MKTPSIPISRHIIVGLFAVCLLLGGFSLQAEDLQVLKLNGRWTQTPTSYYMGNSNSRHALAVSDKWILAGTPSADEQATDQGAVQVYSAVTGAWVRKLLPPTPVTASVKFGDICAVAGDLAVITAAIQFGITRVFIYDLATGKKVRELTVPGVLSGDFFGASIAVSGDRVLVGAWGCDLSRGAAYLFSLRTGAFITRMQPPTSVAGDDVGWSSAADGNLAVIGAPGDSAHKGSAYLYDLRDGTLIKKLTPTSAVAGDNAGQEGVAITEGKVLMTYSGAGAEKLFSIDIVTDTQRTLTASDGVLSDGLGITLAAHAGLAVAGTGEGKAYIFDLRSTATTEMQIIRAADSPFGRFSRGSVAIYQGNILGTDESDNTLANGSGAVYLFRTLTRPLPMTKVAARGDFAPGAAECNFSTLGDAFINPDGEVAFTSKLTGGGSNGGRDTGLWSSQKADLPGWPSGLTTLVIKSRDTIFGSSVTSVGQPLFNRPYLSLYIANRTGSNNEIIMKDDGQVTERLYQNTLGTSELTHTGLVQSHLNDRAAYSITLKTGINSVTTTNDSALVFVQPSLTNQLNPVFETMREGSSAGTTGLIYGQFSARAALYAEDVVYPAAVAGASIVNQAIFRKRYGMSEIVVAQKGNEAPYCSESYSAFIGESTDDTLTDLFRATLAAPTATNEGLWTRNSAGTYTLVMRKGDAVPALNGLKISRFINFWETNGQTLALVTLSGTGVSSANDQALLLYQNTPNVYGQILVLMREGDAAPGSHPATIGTISRVEVETYYGQYLVLATLTGGPAGSNQCLFRGATRKDVTTSAEQFLRRPVAILRKGELFTGRPSKLKSISLPVTNLSAAGAGSTGRSTAMQQTNGGAIPNNIVITLEFDNGLRQIMKGIP